MEGYRSEKTVVPPCSAVAYKLGRRKGCCHPCDSGQNVNIVLEPENWNERLEGMCALPGIGRPPEWVSQAVGHLCPCLGIIFCGLYIIQMGRKEKSSHSWAEGVLSRISDPVVWCLSTHKRKWRKLGAEPLERYYSLLPLPDPESYRQDELMDRSQWTVNTRALVKKYIWRLCWY